MKLESLLRTARGTIIAAALASCGGGGDGGTGLKDTVPPAVSVMSPESNKEYASSTAQVPISVRTNEDATCRTSTSQGKNFSEMEPLSGSGSDHTGMLNVLPGSNALYIRCQDAAGNISSEASTPFSVAQQKVLVTFRAIDLRSDAAKGGTRIPIGASDFVITDAQGRAQYEIAKGSTLELGIATNGTTPVYPWTSYELPKALYGDLFRRAVFTNPLSTDLLADSLKENKTRLRVDENIDITVRVQDPKARGWNLAQFRGYNEPDGRGWRVMTVDTVNLVLYSGSQLRFKTMSTNVENAWKTYFQMLQDSLPPMFAYKFSSANLIPEVWIEGNVYFGESTGAASSLKFPGTWSRAIGGTAEIPNVPSPRRLANQEGTSTMQQSLGIGVTCVEQSVQNAVDACHNIPPGNNIPSTFAPMDSIAAYMHIYFAKPAARWAKSFENKGAIPCDSYPTGPKNAPCFFSTGAYVIP